jgi:hypothetical protein
MDRLHVTPGTNISLCENFLLEIGKVFPQPL